jgi:hypothetical protein
MEYGGVGFACANYTKHDIQCHYYNFLEETSYKLVHKYYHG